MKGQPPPTTKKPTTTKRITTTTRSSTYNQIQISGLIGDVSNLNGLYNKTSRLINGKLSLSSEKIYSSYNLVKSLESRIKFYNGNISVEQFLLNLGNSALNSFFTESFT